jgi:hypothetical protein
MRLVPRFVPLLVTASLLTSSPLHASKKGRRSMQSAQATRTSVATVLLEGPSPPPVPGDPRMLFGQFVGDWEFDVTNVLPDGTTRHRRGEWDFAWILGGRGVQDVWMVPNPAGITPGSFKWRAVSSRDRGATWTEQQVMHVRRKS